MSSIPTQKLDKLVERWESVQAEMNQGAGQAAFARLSKEFAELDPVVGAIRELQRVQAEAGDLAAMIVDPAADKEMSALAREEFEALKPRIEALEQQLRLQLLPKDAA